MANKKYVNNEKDGWNQECEEDLLNLLDELNTKKIKSDEVVNNADDSNEDLMKDLISVIYSFSARMYGLRRKKSKQEIIDFIEH